MIQIGKSIRKLRIELGLAQLELAERCGLTPSFLSLVENGRRRPSLAVIQRVAKALELPEEVLVWDAVDLPKDLGESDRRICEMAKLIVRQFCRDAHASAERQPG